ncbi:hypothetical protein CLBKND_02875 [Methylorubrum aminovorans]
MTNSPPQADPDIAAQRTGLAIALLSLDSVRPFLPLIDFPPEIDALALQHALREAILENREAFQSSGEIPDLRARMLRTLTKRLGASAAEATDAWLSKTFVYAPPDSRPLANWKYVLSDARRDPVRWRRLGLPEIVAERARAALDEALDLKPLHAVDDWVSDRPLSLWDTEMYARHHFHDERRDPYIPIQQTYSGLKFRRFLAWLVANTSADDRARLRGRASELIRERPGQYAAGELLDLADLV